MNAEVIAPNRNELNLLSRESIDGYLKNNSISPDIFIHCAGINELADITEINEKILDESFQVNYFSAISLLNNFVISMKENGWG